MAAQDHVRQFLATDDADDVLDVRAEIDRAAHQVGAFAESGQSRRIDLVPGLAQQPRHPLIAPAAMPGAVNQNEGGHGSFSISGNNYGYSITSSARAKQRRRDGDPDRLRLLRFITRSNRVGYSTGKASALAENAAPAGRAHSQRVDLAR